MSKKKVAVIGGGAAGIAAALEAADNGADVTIFEKNDRVGKKILATGNGKCNLSNLQMTKECFHTSDEKKLSDCLGRFGVKETIAFFEGLGLMIKDKNGYLYPASEQAAVVLDVLRISAARRKICVKTGAKVTQISVLKNAGQNADNISKGNGGKNADDVQFEVCIGKDRECFDRVIMTCGSKAAPKTGSDGSGYELAKALGHSIVPVVPSLVQLKCSDSFCKALAGIRSEACVHIFENGRKICQEIGEVQLTDYGISGIPVFQLSALVNRRLADKRHGEIIAVIDFLPGISEDEFEGLSDQRMQLITVQQSHDKRSLFRLTVEDFFTGMLNKKLMMLFIKLAGLKPELPVISVPKAQLKKVFAYCKGLEYHIIGHNGFENAQVCSGGVDLREVTSDMESKKVPGLFFAGEILDVDGRCGGYNLQWAWTSGVIAGRGVCHD